MRNGFKIAAAIGGAAVVAPLVAAASAYVDYDRDQAALARQRAAYPYPARLDGEALRSETGDPLMFDTPDSAAIYAADISK